MTQNNEVQGLGASQRGEGDGLTNSRSAPTAAGEETTISHEDRLELDDPNVSRGDKAGGSWDTTETASPQGLDPADNAAQSDEAPASRTDELRDAAYYGNRDAFNKDNDLDEHPIDFSSDAAIQEEIAERDVGKD